MPAPPFAPPEQIEQSFMNQTGSKTRQHDEAHASAKVCFVRLARALGALPTAHHAALVCACRTALLGPPRPAQLPRTWQTSRRLVLAWPVARRPQVHSAGARLVAARLRGPFVCFGSLVPVRACPGPARHVQAPHLLIRPPCALPGGAGQKHKRRRLSGSAPPDKAGSLGRSSGGSAKTPSHGPHTPATVAYAPELGRGSGGQPPHTTTPLHPRLQPGAQAATPLPAGAGGAATLLHSLLACAQAGTPLRGEGDTEGPGSSGGGVVGCTPGGVPQPRRPPAANARMPPPSATARRGHRPRPQGGADAAPGAPTPPPHPKAAVPAKRPASPAPLPWGPEGRGASRPAAPEPQRAARGSSKAGGAPAAAPGLEDPELEATLALMSLAPQASALVGGGAPAGAQQRDSPGPAASPRHPAPGRPAAAPASPAGTHGMQQQQQQAPGRPGGRASRLGAARPPLAPAAAPTDPSPRLPQQQRGRAEQGAHASQHVPTRGEVGGGAWGGEAGEEAAGHGGDATSNAAGACTTDGAGGGACPPASAAMLQSMVRAVAAYCHSLQILPTGPNIQLAQAVINLLAGHRPHDACDALHALRPRLPLPDAAGSDDDGAHGAFVS